MAETGGIMPLMMVCKYGENGIKMPVKRIK
jgi:hypothetical protein